MSEFRTKIHKPLFIKKRNPSLNSQLYANGKCLIFFFLISIYFPILFVILVRFDLFVTVWSHR